MIRKSLNVISFKKMQKDNEVYLDPEEDEVFFGWISEKEKNICANLEKNTGFLSREGCTLNEFLKADACIDFKIENENITNQDLNELKIESVGKLCNSQERKRTYSNNTSVELEHNYSTPMKHKIDKNILSTPKSIVKADKDGGFLKVLSEIAIVKAEVEADKEMNKTKTEDEDKENKIVPEIKIIEATPDKANVISPPKNIDTHLRRFRIVYNSPTNKENIDLEKSVNLISINENSETSQNLKNKCLDCVINSKNVENILNSEKRNSVDLCNQSINLLNFNESKILNTQDKVDNSTEKSNVNVENEVSKTDHESIQKIKKIEPELILLDETDSLFDSKTDHESLIQKVKKIEPELILLNEKDSLFQQKNDIQFANIEEDKEKNEDGFNSKELKIDKLSQEKPILPKSIDLCESQSNDKKFTTDLSQVIDAPLNLSTNVDNCKTITNDSVLGNKSKMIQLPLKTPLKQVQSHRFSQEARMIVEVLKKCAVDDTLNFTIPEIDVENIENSFVSPEAVTCFDETLIPPKNTEISKPIIFSGKKSNIKVLSSPVENRLEKKLPKTLEKDRYKMTPVLSQNKITSQKYFSDKRINNQSRNEVKKCVKKIPLEEKRAPASNFKSNGGKPEDKESVTIQTTRIPVIGIKNSKPPISRPLVAKTTPVKTPIAKSSKNPKFNNIESPINAYIHNKPTSLILNIRPKVKKDGVTKLWKTQTTSSEKKIEKSASEVQKPKNFAPLPFVQYQSATPYKVEKRPESKLPRLAPTIQKLIGSHSPKVLKHEGKFYGKTPKKQISSQDTTILADTNEVSVVISQVAQKSNTIK